PPPPPAIHTLSLHDALPISTFAVAGDAGKSQFKADTLTGYQEVAGPGTISTIGSGTFEASLNGAGDEISYTLTYGDLEGGTVTRSEEHTSELQSRFDLVCRL